MAKKPAAKAAPTPTPSPVANANLNDAPNYTIAAVELPLDLIDEEEGFNPRGEIDETDEEFVELVGSVREHRVRQPIEVRPRDNGRFFVTFGHRRRRAALAAGHVTIPAVIRAVSAVEALDAAMIENLQRADMNAMAMAHGFRRMIEQRQALDPNLSIKDAKEQVAIATRKSVRLIELRLQYLDLPPAMQESLQKGEINGKDATEWLRKRPKLLDLTDRQWLIALEVFDAQSRAPAPKANEFQPDAALCQPAASTDDDVVALVGHPAQMLSPVAELRDADHERTGRFAVRFYEHRLEQLTLKFGPIDHEDVRDKALAEARKRCGFKSARKEGLDPRYAASWLNGPFEPSAEALAAIAAEKAERQARIEEQERERQEAEAARTARFEAGRTALTRALTIETDLRAGRLEGASPPPVHPDFEAILAEGGKPLPWFATDFAGVFAANGVIVFDEWPEEPPPGVVALIRLTVVAVNAAAGLPTPEAPPEEQSVEPDDEALAASDETGSPEPAEDEEELEDAAPKAEADDEEIAPYLRRLVGGGSTAEAGA